MISPTVELGPFTFHLYGLIAALSIFIAWHLAKKRSKSYKIPKKIFDDWQILIPIFLSLVGARIYHVLDYWNFYKNNPISIFLVQNGGLGIWGGLFGFLAGCFLLSKFKKIDFLNFMDLVSPSILLAQAIGRIGNYINQEGFGPPTNLPWKLFINIENRSQDYKQFEYFHPTFFYELILDLIFFVILISFSKKLKRGQIFALYLFLYSLGRFFVEFFRIDTWEIAAVKVAHVLAFLTAITAVWLFKKSSHLTA